jgi:hypothetical protein
MITQSLALGPHRRPSASPQSTDLVVGAGFKAAMLPAYPRTPDSAIRESEFEGRTLPSRHRAGHEGGWAPAGSDLDCDARVLTIIAHDSSVRDGVEHFPATLHDWYSKGLGENTKLGVVRGFGAVLEECWVVEGSAGGGAGGEVDTFYTIQAIALRETTEHTIS